MRGDGTKLGTIPNRAPEALLLDVTRLVRRAGRMPTGVDRAERAYFDRFLSLDTQVFFLFRSSLGYILLDRAGGEALKLRLDGRSPWGQTDLRSRFLSRLSPEIRRAESDLRRLCIGRASRLGLRRLLRRHIIGAAAYFNVGHSNLDDRTLSAIAGADIRINILIHDVIPLDFPQYQKPGTVEIFRKRLRAAQRHADRLIYNSADTKSRAETVLAKSGRVPEGLIAHLGVTLPDATGTPAIPLPDRPFFLTVGTIEPRKGHGLLLDVWEDMIRDNPGKDVPLLLICGARGWNNQEVFDRLDALPPDGPMRELSGLDDATIAALMTRSLGLLFPSHAEGYGLPPLEAAALGCPVICPQLDVFKELLGNIPVYVESYDRYLWRSIIERLDADQLVSSVPERQPNFVPPNWDDHFNAVLSHD